MVIKYSPIDYCLQIYYLIHYYSITITTIITLMVHHLIDQLDQPMAFTSIEAKSMAEIEHQ